MPSPEAMSRMMSPEAVAERRRKAFEGAIIPPQDEIDKLVHPKEAARQKADTNPAIDLFRRVAEAEGLLVDACMERAVKIVTENFLRAGGDSSPEGGGTIMNFVETAGPLSVELYRQCLIALRTTWKSEYEAVDHGIVSQNTTPA